MESVGSTGFGGGLLSTAGGLLFSAELNGEFVAYDSKTGRTLWHFYTGQPISAQPITYTVDSKQYVGIAAGGDIMSFGLFEATGGTK
jgi:alcohol dehydrogenase (cytochrome c)